MQPDICCNPNKTEESTSCDADTSNATPNDTSNAEKTTVILLSVFLGVLLPACVFVLLWFNFWPGPNQPDPDPAPVPHVAREDDEVDRAGEN